MPNRVAACPLRSHVDPRLLRFSAGATDIVLAVALLVLDVVRPLGLGLIGSQVAVFGFTALAVASFIAGFDTAGYGLTALAFTVAALNASTGL